MMLRSAAEYGQTRKHEALRVATQQGSAAKQSSCSPRQSQQFAAALCSCPSVCTAFPGAMARALCSAAD